ncbi:NADAR family protein [Chitinophaga agrisoli]|uniref:NADAR family protein n=1 Tax=Chitinophaga agrisoli TaxID=2607653 RepID=A0A5B2W2D8_9BACT|nr:NADAR family protein [Chitinophaga agrisoli]KAA2244910.1 NADAR family protein [Chitinophaga agrisoli]
MNYNNNWLRERYNAGEQLKYLFFWGHQPSADGSVTKSCFSQWWVSPFTVDGITYKTAEHWMMAGKARLFNDAEILEEILQADSPAEAKQLGRKVRDFDAASWDQHKFTLVVDGNFHKFSQQEPLRTFLANTGDRVLAEASPRDAIWGIGMGASNPNVENPLLWKGQNLLGYALMETRDKLK